MGRIWVPAGVKGYDASSPPTASSMVADGGQYIMRYLSPYTHGLSNMWDNPKNLKPGEIQAYDDAGLGIGINGEWDAATMLHGDGPNDTLSQAVRIGCDRYGVPDSTVLWWSMDTDCQPSQYDVTRAAFDAYRRHNPNNQFGVYGGSQYIEWCMDEGYCDFGWIASALYWSRTSRPVDNVTVFRFPHDTSKPFQFNYYISPRCHVRQVGGATFGGGTVDVNLSTQNVPFWLPSAPDNPDPGDPLTQLTIFHIFLRNGQQLDTVLLGYMDDRGLCLDFKWCRSGDRENLLRFLGAPTVNRYVDELHNTDLSDYLPTGDRFYTWTGAEFASYQKAPTAPGPAVLVPHTHTVPQTSVSAVTTTVQSGPATAV